MQTFPKQEHFSLNTSDLPLSSMSPHPCVTIAIPTIGRDTLQNTIDSIYRQTYNKWVILVSDNGLGNSAQKLCESYSDGRIHYVRHSPPLTAVENYNYCLSLGDTELFVLMHDDDTFEPSYLEAMVSMFAEYPDAQWGFCNATIYKSTGQPSRILANYNLPSSHWTAGKAFVNMILSQQVNIIMPLVMYRKQISKFIRFNPDLPAMCDLYMWLELSSRFNAVYLSHALFNYMLSDGNGTIDRIFEGSFYRDSTVIVKWIQSKCLFLSPLRRLFLALKISFHQSILLLWSAYKYPNRELSPILQMLDSQNGLLPFLTHSILRSRVLISWLGLILFHLRRFFK